MKSIKLLSLYCLIFALLQTSLFAVADIASDLLDNDPTSVHCPGGNHLLIELYGCAYETITVVNFVAKTLKAAALATGATIVGESFYQFTPEGVSGALVLAESHITIHTWPKQGYCSVDIFTCGTMDNFAACKVLIENFKAQNYRTMDVRRGINSFVKVIADTRDQVVLQRI